MLRCLAIVALFVATQSTALLAQTSPEYGDDVYKPSMGQAAKDVIWIPPPEALITALLTAARVTDKDIVYDLGAGDGRIPIAAAKQFGARAVGIEYDADMAELARRNTRRAGVEEKVRIITGDIFKESFADATVLIVTLDQRDRGRLAGIGQQEVPAATASGEQRGHRHQSDRIRESHGFSGVTVGSSVEGR